MKEILLLVVGALLGIASSYFALISRLRSEKRYRLEDDLRRAYVEMMKACRELRTEAKRRVKVALATSGSGTPRLQTEITPGSEEIAEDYLRRLTSEETDDRRNAVSVAFYQISILANEESVQVAENYRKQVFKYVKKAEEDPLSAECEAAHMGARHAHDALERLVRKEIGLAKD